MGELEGRCYQRTPQGGWRSGVWEGNVEPNGAVAHHTMDPDKEFQGKWMVGGRVERIDLGQNLIYLKGRGDDILKMRIDHNSPYFYCRMPRTPDSLPLPWREGMPEVRPILGRDIIPGDYLYINMSGPGVEIRNWKTSDENYQALIDAQKSGLIHPAVITQVYQ